MKPDYLFSKFGCVILSHIPYLFPYVFFISHHRYNLIIAYHTGGQSHTSPWGGDQTAFTESMAEAGKSVSDYLGGGERIVYVNVMNRISIDCDCDGNPSEPDLHDIGILASTDPVALDQACIDLVYAQKNGDGASLVNRIESRNGLHTLEHAEEIGLGSRSYTLVSIDN